MTLLPSLVNALVVAIAAAFIWYVTRGQNRALIARMDGLDGRIDGLEGRIDRLEDRMEARFDRVEAEIASLRSDLTHVALAVGARPRPQTG